MRAFALAGVIAVLAAVPAAAQSPSPYAYGLDPYNPTDAAVLRSYGSALVAQTPLLELGALDPYNPTQAKLLRETGAIPLCCVLWGSPTFGPLTPASRLGDRFAPAPPIIVMPSSAPPATAPSASAAPAGPVTTAIRPEGNAGITIRFAGRTYASAGRAVVLQASEFQLIGESSGAPVYRRLRATDGIIYVRSRAEMVAPYRPTP